MITLEKLTEELDVNQIDEVVAGAWTTKDGNGNPKSSGSDDDYAIGLNLGPVFIGTTFKWTWT